MERYSVMGIHMRDAATAVGSPLYKHIHTLVKEPVVTYATEIVSMTNQEKGELRVFERKAVRTILVQRK